MRTAPPSGRSNRPATCSIVDLPAPDGPTSATISPGASRPGGASEATRPPRGRGDTGARAQRAGGARGDGRGRPPPPPPPPPPPAGRARHAKKKKNPQQKAARPTKTPTPGGTSLF